MSGHDPGGRCALPTASGLTTAYATRLETVELAGLAARDVAGVIVPDMPGDTVLLGMSFLSRFAVRMEGGEMHIGVRTQ